MVTNADYCRQLGFNVGDMIEGTTPYSNVRLKIKWLGDSVMVVDRYEQVKNGDFWMWEFAQETAQWNLFGRKWEKVIE